MEYIFLAAAPGIAICLYFFYKDIYNREPTSTLVTCFILGCAAILPAIVFEKSINPLDGSVRGVAIFSYLVVAFSEEGSKFLGLRFFAFRQKSFDEPLDGIVYSVMVSMGFATVENIMYVLSADQGKALQIGLFRMFLSVPAHATFAIVMGYFVGKAKFDKANSLKLMILGLAGAIFFHGTFDFFLFVGQYSYIGRDTGEGLLAIGAIVSFIISIILCRKLIRRQKTISMQMFKDKNTTTTGV